MANSKSSSMNNPRSSETARDAGAKNVETSRPDVLMVDNYDSFTWNVVQYFWELGASVDVYRNDEITVEDIDRIRPKRICVSPGPCSPAEAGISIDTIKRFAGDIPVFGICLGLQSMGAAYGGDVVRAPEVMHGKTSPVCHNGTGVFAGLPSPFTATRYHSLIVDPKTLPSCFEVTAWTLNEQGERDVIMGLRHKEVLVEGVQFHPESILTEHGRDMLQNFLGHKA